MLHPVLDARLRPRLPVFVAAVLAVAACSKDRPEPPPEPERVTPASAPGVSPVSVAELSPEEVKAAPVPISSRSAEAVERFVRGRELLERERADAALAELEAALELDDDFALATAYLASATKGDTRRDLAKTALELAPKLERAEQLAVEITALRALGKRDEIDAMTAELVEVAPGDFRALLWHGKSLQRAGRSDDAIAAFERAVALAPEQAAVAEAYNVLAYARAAAGKLDAALAAAERYVALRPDEANPRDTLGEMLLLAGKLEQAEASFLAAVERDPGFPLAWQGVAMARLYAGDRAGALKAFRAAAEGEKPGKYARRAYEELAWAQLALGDPEAALATVAEARRRALAAGLEDAEAHADMVRAEMLLLAGKGWKARKLIEGVVERLDRDVPAQRKVARWASVIAIQAQLEQNDAAAAAATLAALDRLGEGAEPEFVHALAFARGLVAHADGRADQAVAELETIARPTAPYWAQGGWLRAAALDAAGRGDEAAALRGRLARERSRNVFTALMQRRNARAPGVGL